MNHSSPGDAAPRPILLIRPGGNQADAAALTALGLQPWIDPYLSVGPLPEASGAHTLLAALDPGVRGWVLVTSQRALPAWEHLVGGQVLHSRLRACAASGWRVGAIGAGTAATVPDLGWANTVVPPRASAADLAAAVMHASSPARAVIPQSRIALGVLGDTLTGAGWDVVAHAVYQTQPIEPQPASAPALVRGDVAAVVLRSPSAARALFHFGPPAPHVLLVAAGETTAAAVAELGRVPIVAATPHASDVASAVATALGMGGQPQL